MPRPSAHGANRTDNSQSRFEKDQNNRIQSIGANAVSLNKQVSSLTRDAVKLNTHLATSDNNFSIDNVNTIAELFGEAVERLNWTINLINENETEIINTNSYSKIIRPIMELKYGPQKENDDFNIDIFQFAKQNIIYFYQSTSEFDDKYIYNINEPNKTIFKELNEKFYDPTAKLINDNATVLSSSNRLYNCIFGLTVRGIDIHIQCIMTDVLDKTKHIIISETLCITRRMAQIDSYDTIPSAFSTYLTTVQDKFNNFASTKYDPILGTVYQFGPDNKFNTLKVVSSAEYPSWNDQLIVYSYIPGSNIDMPTIIFNINAELNRHYTGMSEGEIVIVEYAIGPIYYTGVVKMLKIDGYDGLCYQIQTVNINELFPTSVTMTGDVAIQGNLNILRYNGEKVITTDNTRKVVSFHDKVGINQHPYEVNGLLDIDNLTQQTVLGLFDAFVPYSVNSTDIIQFIDYLSIKSPDSISSLFEQGNSLFDYKNQCTVFSVPIKAIIDASDISIIHTDSFVVGDGTSGTVTGLGKSIITSDYSFTRLQQVVKEVNQMLPEVDNANDPSFVFSFVGILQSLDKKSYMKSARAIIDIDNDNETPSGKRLIFVMTYLDVTDIMNDDSTGKPLLKVTNYMSKEFRFINYVSLLFKNNSDLYDASGNLATDSSGNILLRKSIQNNEYFSDRMGLLPESFIYASDYDAQIFLLHEDKLQWNNKKFSDLWNGSVNVARDVSDHVRLQRSILYNNAINSTHVISYFWNSFVQVNNTVLIKVSTGGKERTLLIGSAFYLDTLLNQSLVVNGDNTISGNFFVNDSNDNNIFKVDNVNKTITNMYKVGIGMDEPNSILDIKDTTVSDILSELDSGRQQYNLLSKISTKLRNIGNNPDTAFNDTTDFKTIIDDVYTELSITQTVDNFARLYELNMDTMLADDIVVLRQYLYPHWDGKKVGQIQDAANQFSLNFLKEQGQRTLDTELIYDGGLILRFHQHVFGWKFTRGVFLKIGGKMYLLAISTNVQSFGLRPDSNTNITTFTNAGILGNMMTNRIYTYMNNITGVNEVESFNALRRLNMECSDISLNSFILTIDTADISNTTIQDIYLFDRAPIPDSVLESVFNDFDTDGDGYLTGEEIDAFSQVFGIQVSGLNALDLNSDSDNKISLNDISPLFKPLTYGETKLVNRFPDYNRTARYKNFWVTFTDKKYNNNMSKNDFNVICYEDLYFDYVTGIKCIEVSGNVFTLLCNELPIQSIINPALSVEGDTKVVGDLLVTNKSDGVNYVSIDPDHYFMGIGTDERFINYQDRVYNTTSNQYAGRHNVNISHNKYPVMVIERIREFPITEAQSLKKMESFRTYSTLTSKRRSKLYEFDELIANASAYNDTFKMGHPNDTVTHMKYGPDISFEVCDKTDRTIELGQIGMSVDRIEGDSGHVAGCFSVYVFDSDLTKTTTTVSTKRSILHVDNDSQLFVRKINLDGQVLSTDGSGNLLWNGKKVLTE